MIVKKNYIQKNHNTTPKNIKDHYFLIFYIQIKNILYRLKMIFFELKIYKSLMINSLMIINLYMTHKLMMKLYID